MGIQTQSTTRVDNTSTLSSCSYLHVLLAVQSEAADGLDLSVGRSSRRALEAELDWGGKLRVQLIGQISHHAQGVLQTLNTQTGNKKWISVKRATETNGLKAASLSHRADSDELQTLKAQKEVWTLFTRDPNHRTINNVESRHHRKLGMTEDSVALVLEARTSRYPVSVAPTPALTRGQTKSIFINQLFSFSFFMMHCCSFTSLHFLTTAQRRFQRNNWNTGHTKNRTKTYRKCLQFYSFSNTFQHNQPEDTLGNPLSGTAVSQRLPDKHQSRLHQAHSSL